MRRWILATYCIGTLACSGLALAHGGHDPDSEAAPAPAGGDAGSFQESGGFADVGEHGNMDHAPGVGFYMEDMDPAGTALDDTSTYGDASAPPEDPMEAPALGESLRKDPLAVMGSPMAPNMEDHSGMEGMAGHNMVDPATHTLVTSDSKGYAAAAAITLLTGLVFGFLTLKRPLE